MQFALDQFNYIITRIRDLIALHNNLKVQVSNAYEIGNRWDIEESFVTDAINFIEGVVHSIDDIIR